MFHVGAEYHHLYFKDVYVKILSSQEMSDHFVVVMEWKKLSNDETINLDAEPYKIEKDNLSKWRYGKYGLI